MPPKPLLLCLICLSAFAQNPDAAALEAQAVSLRGLVEHAPALPLHRTEVKLQPPGSGWEIGYPSSVAMDKSGLLYVLQRGEKADPVLVVNQNGRIIRSWGKGMFKIPHSIRIDPSGNLWTVDASSSMIFKFTPMGEKMMEISVGGQPAAKTGFAGATDIAFAPNGHLFISDGYGNARILEYTADGKSDCGSGEAPAPVRDSFASLTESPWMTTASSMWLTARMAVCNASIKRESISASGRIWEW